MIDGSTVIPFDRIEERSQRGRALLERCREVARQHLERLVRHVLDHVDDTLFAMADKAENNRVQDLYFEAMREIRRQREPLQRTFLEAFTRRSEEALRPRQLPEAEGLPPSGAEGLSLLSEEEQEEAVALDALVGKLRDRLRPQLHALEQRLDHALPGLHVDEARNPLGPEVVCAAFQEAARPLEVDVRVRLILYKLMDQYLTAHAGALYEELNRTLAEAGILPRLRVGKPLIRSSAPSRADGRNPTEPLGATETPPGEQDLLQLLQQLVTGPGGSAAPIPAMPAAPAAPTAPAVLPAEELLRGLSSLQRAPLASPTTEGGEGSPSGPSTPGTASAAVLPSGEALRAGIAQALGLEGRAFDPIQATVIDVVGLIFEFILEDPALPERARGLLARLQIPVVKVALLDRAFFSSRQHPARRLLNELAHAAAASAEEGPAGEQFLAHLEGWVERILREFEDDVAVFAQVLEELEGHLTEERARREQEAAAALAAKARAETAVLRAAEVVEAALAGRRLPEVARRFLDETWREVLRRTWEAGEDTPPWPERAEAAETLAWSVGPKTTAEERQELARRLPGLLQVLREGLEAIGRAPEAVEAAVEALHVCHLASLRGVDAEQLAPVDGAEGPACAVPELAAPEELEEEVQRLLDQTEQAGPPEPPSLDLAGEPPEPAPTADHPAGLPAEPPAQAAADAGERGDPELEAWLARVEALPVGTWMSFRTPDGTRRGKLAWKSDVLRECVFVSRTYAVVAEFHYEGLARAWREGDAQVVEDVPLFDRALDAVVQGLMRRRAAAPEEAGSR